MRKTSRRRQARTVVGMLEQQPQNKKHILQALAAYLVVHKQQKQLDLLLLDIAHEFTLTTGHLYAKITSAHPLDAATYAELEKYLTAATGASAVEFDEQTDSDLLAGMIVKTADQELDTSARSKLTRLTSLNVNTPEKA